MYDPSHLRTFLTVATPAIFEEHYTVSFENYPVDAERVHGLTAAECSYRKRL